MDRGNLWGPRELDVTERLTLSYLVDEEMRLSEGKGRACGGHQSG